MGSSTGAAGRGESKSPKQSTKTSSSKQDATTDAKNDASLSLNADSTTHAKAPAEPLAPPPRPGQPQAASNSPDYFNGGSLSLEPNPFEQSFGGAPPETPGGTKLPSVHALTSPSALLPTGATPFAWPGGSLRTGPLSPAMLSGPTTDYFSETHHMRGGFPTPNESSLRTGLTPGGSGTMFPGSPTSQTLFAQMSGAAPTPGTIDFHRTALSAAAAKREQQAQAQTQVSQPPAATSQPADMSNGVPPLKPDTKPPSGPFDPHDNDAANGLFMLAQGRGSAPPPPVQQYPVLPPNTVHAHPSAIPPPVQTINTSPQMNSTASLAGSSARGVSEVSARSEDSETARPARTTRSKKRNSTSTANGRRKADDAQPKGPASKKTKTNGGGAAEHHDFDDMDHSDGDSDEKDHKEGGSKPKMTEEEKRKNFLERNRVAALKCRQRKKQWLASLQNKVEVYSSENDALTAQISQLREEVVNLKTLLLAHKDCPVTQQQGLQVHGAFMQQPLDAAYPAPINPYGMGAPMPNQTVMAGQGVGSRRFS